MTYSIRSISKPENCACCSRPIRAGHPFILCHQCNCIIHKKCKTATNIVKFRDETYCNKCCNDHDIIRYNPFYQPPYFANNDLLDDEPIDYIDSINTTSSILEACQSYSMEQLNSGILPSNQKNFFSSF